VGQQRRDRSQDIRAGEPSARLLTLLRQPLGAGAAAAVSSQDVWSC
jgi:hypothetical protein